MLCVAVVSLVKTWSHTAHTFHGYTSLGNVRTEDDDVHCIANSTDMYDAEAFMIYNKVRPF